MDNSQIALITSGIAAVFSIMSVSVNVFLVRVNRKKEMHSLLVEKHLECISSTLHQVVSVPTILVIRKKQGKTITTWEHRDKDAIDKLKEIMASTRYIFGDLYEGFRVLTRLNNWVHHCLDDLPRASTMVSYADQLRVALDMAILDSYKRGGFPSKSLTKIVNTKAKQLREYWGASENGTEEE